MKVDRIMPCICIDHAPGFGDSGTYGMPEMKVYSCGPSGEYGYRYIPYCPSCGRGGISDYKSDYFALKGWNEMQLSLWRYEAEGVLEDEITDCEPWRKEFYKELKSSINRKK